MRDSTTTPCVLFPDLFRKPLVAQFDRPDVSSDGGAIVLKAAAQLVAEEKPAHVVIHVHVEVAASTTGVAPPAPPPLAPTSTPSVDTDHQPRKDDE